MIKEHLLAFEIEPWLVRLIFDVIIIKTKAGHRDLIAKIWWRVSIELVEAVSALGIETDVGLAVLRSSPDVHEVGVDGPGRFGRHRHGNAVGGGVLEQRPAAGEASIELGYPPRSHDLPIAETSSSVF